ncbi:hypothetical protein ACFX2I_025078 [Malus domestica]
MRCWKEAGMLPLLLKPTGSTGFTTGYGSQIGRYVAGLGTGYASITGYRSQTEAKAFETSTFGSAITPMLPKCTFIS